MKKDVVCWVDIESTGTNIYLDEIMEIAYVFSDIRGNRLTDTKHFLVDFPQVSALVESCSPSAMKIHEKSGLFYDLALSTLKRHSLVAIDEMFASDLDKFAHCRILLGGNSVFLDRGLMMNLLPGAYCKLSHMSVDVTSLSLMLEGALGLTKGAKSVFHRAKQDVEDSLAEYRSYVDRLRLYVPQSVLCADNMFLVD